MNYNLADIRKLVKNALPNQDFDNFVFDYFPSVREQFTDGQLLDARIRLLLDYANTRREIPKLLNAIQECNPTVYQEFASKLGNSIKPDTDLAQSNQEVKQCDVLVLTANPIGTNLLKLEQEANLIRQRLQEGAVGKNLVVKVEWAVRIEDLSKHLLQSEPRIIHFSGHSNSSGDIILHNAQGQAQTVSPIALAELLPIASGRVECVVLNTCFSLEKADALAEQVGCVIGMEAEIDDESAVRFAAGFYRGLGFGRGYYSAFELGCSEINLLNLPDRNIPHFITRDSSYSEPEAETPRVTRTFPTQQNATVYPLWFGTNRRPNDMQNLAKGFSNDRDRQIHYGTCEVTVPRSHKIGSVGTPWWKFVLTDDRLKLKRDSLCLLNAADFLAGIKQALQKEGLDDRSALVFIHGFNVSFEDAARQAAQMGVDLQMKGIMAFYSWPSQGNLIGYTADEATIEASEQYIAEFLLNLAQNSGVEKVHIIAHSMGNRGLLRAMQRIIAKVQTETSTLFGQIFLAAPDVDPDVFRGLAEAYQKLAERTTLYVSAKDKALFASRILHNHTRLGFFPPIAVVDGIDTVEVSNIDVTWLGHGYFANARPLLEDIYALLKHNTPPERRFGLRSVVDGTQHYWRIGK
ncbi:alpha/beta hydrolase [Tumidithrix elongata RA019]|uniref:Alpha/beta hydrolase n=1 Tax=Tumidithrix elongata BACA0141 TaxID=2716417 RepID=A0AAW9Q352_9CYAN|nr:alpha/beta hydrolase [Tumidithrix elongata RA019]